MNWCAPSHENINDAPGPGKSQYQTAAWLTGERINGSAEP